MSLRTRGFCYTLNNYTEEELVALRALDCKYHVMGYEVGPECGTPHIQGYIYFNNKKSFKQVKELIPRAHIENQSGPTNKAIEYCTKGGSYEELGVAPMSQNEKGICSKRRWEDAFAAAKVGKLDEIPEDLFIRYYSTFKKIREDYQEPPESIDHLCNEWYYGGSGTGKSRKARSDNPKAYIKNTNKWWDRYNNQDVVIIEEFSPCHEVLASHLKIWADHYPFQGEVKGGSRLIRPKKIIVTSNYHPLEIFQNHQDLEPILRRFKLTHFNPPLQ